MPSFPVKRRAVAGLFVFFLCSSLAFPESVSLRDEQLKYVRVRTAATEKEPAIRSLLQEKHLAYPPRAIFFRAFKKEGVLELWAADKSEDTYTLLKTYKICATSGVLGPKRRFGDEQVPEGFYELDWFNPQSNFYLSMHINYPNASDRILGAHKNPGDPGGNIFLHGNCVTIGCIPITDDGIKEVYWISVLAKSAGQRRIPLEIFPARLTNEGLLTLRREHPEEPSLLAFWENLKTGFDAFEKNHRPPEVSVGNDGRYAFPAEKSTGAAH